MTTDPYKAMTVQYNHLNLPKKMTFGNDYIETRWHKSPIFAMTTYFS